MSKRIVRFIGDPTGYDINYEGEIFPPPYPMWIKANVGTSGVLVDIDLSKAYLIESEPPVYGTANGLSGRA